MSDALNRPCYPQFIEQNKLETILANIQHNFLTSRRINKKLNLDESGNETSIEPALNTTYKLFTFDLESQQIRFDDNLSLLNEDWEVELKTFADIGSVTTSTQGSTLIRFKKGKGAELPKKMDEMLENRGFNGGQMEIGILSFWVGFWDIVNVYFEWV